MAIEIYGFELDTFDKDDQLCPYRRVFSGDAGEWLGSFGPGNEDIDLERGWRYAANILVRHGATEPPPADPDNTKPLRLWLDYWTTLLTRPLFHLGNHRYAWSIHLSITLPHSAPYPKWPKAAPLMIHEANDY